MADIRIRPLEESDIPQAVALWVTCKLTRPWNDPGADALLALNGPSSTILSGWLHGELVGTAMVGHDGHRGAVYYVGVRPDLQKSGVGALLMAAVEQWLKERGVPKLNVMVRTDNLAATGFYQKLGYASADVTVLAKRLDEDAREEKPEEQ